MKMKTLLAEVKAVESDNPNGEFVVILSAPTLDRDGEIVDAKCFEPLPDHITFDIDHGMSTATTIGSGTPYYDGDLLKVKGTYSSIPRAQDVRTLVVEGHIRTTSVAFMGAKKEVKDGVPHITKAELLNGAFVPVPSNREAVVVSAKSADLDAPGNVGLIQDAHDKLAALGATCGGTKSVRRAAADQKSMVGSYEELREALRDALQDAYADAWWVSILATFTDRIVYEVWGGANDEMQFETPYTWDGTTVTFGTAVAVEVHEVATPVAGDGETRSAAPSAEDAKGASGDEPTREDTSGAGGDDDEQQHLELRARALQLLARSVT